MLDKDAHVERYLEQTGGLPDVFKGLSDGFIAGTDLPYSGYNVMKAGYNDFFDPGETLKVNDTPSQISEKRFEEGERSTSYQGGLMAGSFAGVAFGALTSGLGFIPSTAYELLGDTSFDRYDVRGDGSTV